MGSDKGTKTEIKNLNSMLGHFSFLQEGFSMILVNKSNLAHPFANGTIQWHSASQAQNK